MKKELVMMLTCLLLFQLISATVEVTSQDINKEYLTGEKITGTAVFNISGEYLDAVISSNLGTSMTLEEFLDSNNEDDYCETQDCESTYSKNSPSSSKLLSLGENRNKTLGIFLTGDPVDILDQISFSMIGSFPEQSQIPLTINYLDEFFWEQRIPSGTYSDSISSYNPDSVQTLKPIFTEAGLCQAFSINKTESLRIEVITEGETAGLELSVYGDLSSEKLSLCSGVTSCSMYHPQGYFEEGDYYSCVRKVGTDAVSIKTEDLSANLDGIVLSSGEPTQSNLNYGFLIGTENYQGASGLDTVDFLSKFNSKIEDYLDKKYGNSCSNGCILPIMFQGISQDLALSDLVVNYLDGEVITETNFYELSVENPKVKFNGVLDLSKLNLIVEDKDSLKLYLDGNQILTEDLDITENRIEDLYPREIPAGIPINFSLILNGESSGNATYSWRFGDGTNLTTENPWVEHTYLAIQNYSLAVGLNVGNTTETKEFQVITSSPNEVILLTLDNKKKTIKDLINDSDDYSFSNKLKEVLNLVSLNNQLNNIARDYQNSSTEEDLILISRALFSINIPTYFSVDEIEDFLIFERSSINVANVAQISGETSDNSKIEDYQNSIEKWFANNMVILTKTFTVKADFESENSKKVLRGYELSIDSKADETSYLVINAPINSLYFDPNPSPKSVGESTYIAIQPGEKKTIQFSRLETNNLEIFATPRLSSLVLDETDLSVNSECNFNGRCEVGENSSSCRDDCKPVVLIGGIIIGVIFIFGVLLVGFSLWYQRHKEEILFGDRRQLFNLVAFIKNTRTKNIADEEIQSLLIKKGWVKERISYAFSKTDSLGKINLSSFNNFIDKKVYDKVDITQDKQQTSQKINKPKFQDNNRKR